MGWGSELGCRIQRNSQTNSIQLIKVLNVESALQNNNMCTENVHST